jgi:hypothetical protein
MTGTSTGQAQGSLPASRIILKRLKGRTMKHLMLAVPATLLMATAGIAQTDTTAGASGEATASGEFGTNWPLSVGTTFLTDDSSATVRPAEELSKGWQSLSPEDQTMIRTDCQAFLAAHTDAGTSGDTSASDSSAVTTGTATTEGSTDSMASTDAATGSTSIDTTATDTTKTGTAETGAGTETDMGAASTDTTATGDAATTVSAGYDMAEMKAICEAVGTL